MSDLAGFEKYIITIHGAFEMQQIEIINGEEATQVAERLRNFLKGSYEITLEGFSGGEAIFDSEGEYSHHEGEKTEELTF